MGHGVSSCSFGPLPLSTALGHMGQPLSQATVCERFASPFEPPRVDDTIGIAIDTLSQHPVNALRHPAQGGTCGWFIWGGELSAAPDFFTLLHVHHLVEHAPTIIPYLGLAPGWRVLLAPAYEDVWYDPALLAV